MAKATPRLPSARCFSPFTAHGITIISTHGPMTAAAMAPTGTLINGLEVGQTRQFNRC